MSEVRSSESLMIQRWWEAQAAAYANLDELTNVSPSHKYGLAWNRAFQARTVFIGCIDERVPNKYRNWLKLPIAGSGVLLTTEQRLAVVERIQKAGVDVRVISYHEGCGACQAVAHEQGLEAWPLSEQVAREMNESFGLNQAPWRIGYGPASDHQMAGDPRFHHARAIVVTGSTYFDSGLLGWPDPFLVSARFAADDQALRTEVGFAISIANGQHGMGNARLRQQPLLIVIIGDPRNAYLSAEAIEARLAPILGNHQDIIKIILLTAPIG